MAWGNGSKKIILENRLSEHLLKIKKNKIIAVIKRERERTREIAKLSPRKCAHQAHCDTAGLHGASAKK